MLCLAIMLGDALPIREHQNPNTRNPARGTRTRCRTRHSMLCPYQTISPPQFTESHMKISLIIKMNRIIATAIFFLALAATPAMAQHTVALSWTASTTSGATYNVYRQQACSGNFTQINASAVTATTYADAAVAPGETYCYQVTAALSGVESAPSNYAPATIPAVSAIASTGTASNSQAAARNVCTRRGSFVAWAKCVATLPRKSN
jgi:hypothetical protein